MPPVRSFFVVFMISLIFVDQVKCFPSGAPSSACATLVPSGHTGTTQASDVPGGFYIYTDLLDNGGNGMFTLGTTYTVTLTSLSGREFLGFLIQARLPGTTTPIGSFNTPAGSQHLSCSGEAESTVTHTDNSPKTSITFQWTAPSSSSSATLAVEIRYTVVTDRDEDYYANLNAADYRPPLNCSLLSHPTAFGEHNIRHAIPAGCSGTDCDYYVGLSPNKNSSEYLDIYLESDATGWAAIGFSLNQMMESDDVMGCRYKSGTAEVIDTWNTNALRSGNALDSNQIDICVHSVQFSNNRISCSFSRLIRATNPGQDYNLNSTYWLLYGWRTTAQTGGNAFAKHSSTPTISDVLYNPVTDSKELDEAPVNPSNTIPVPTTSAHSAVATPSTTPTAPAEVIAGQCSFQPSSVGDYSFEYGIQGQSDYYIATRINPYDTQYLDIVLEGVANGWTAVGFSRNRQMQEDDVLGCRVADDTVVAVDSWNPSTRHSPNVIDNNQDDVCIHSGSFTNGRITCRFSRRIIGSNSGQDYDLTDEYYLLYGRRSAAQPSQLRSLGYHGPTTPTISEELVSVVCPDGPDFDTNYTYTYEDPSDVYIVKTQVNPDDSNYLDIYLEGEAFGWIALGLSQNKLMNDDDVFGCRVDSGVVTAIDTWNPSTRHDANVPDSNLADMCFHSGSIANGRISCVFSRLISGTGTGQDYNLNNSYYLLYGRGISALHNPEILNFPNHNLNGGVIPTISARKTNIVTGVSAGVNLTPSVVLVAIQLMIMLLIGARNIF